MAVHVDIVKPDETYIWNGKPCSRDEFRLREENAELKAQNTRLGLQNKQLADALGQTLAREADLLKRVYQPPLYEFHATSIDPAAVEQIKRKVQEQGMSGGMITMPSSYAASWCNPCSDRDDIRKAMQQAKARMLAEAETGWTAATHKELIGLKGAMETHLGVASWGKDYQKFREARDASKPTTPEVEKVDLDEEVEQGPTLRQLLGIVAEQTKPEVSNVKMTMVSASKEKTITSLFPDMRCNRCSGLVNKVTVVGGMQVCSACLDAAKELAKGGTPATIEECRVANKEPESESSGWRDKPSML